MRRRLAGVHSSREQSKKSPSALDAPNANVSQTPASPVPERIVGWETLLWGPDKLIPGGADEIRRLASLLGLKSGARLLVAGVGAEGAARVVAATRKHPVSAVLTASQARSFGDAGSSTLVAETASLVGQEVWDPAAPGFLRRYHRALLLDAGRLGAATDALPGALAKAMYEGGEAVFVDLVAGLGAQGEMARWVELESRAQPPTEAAVGRSLSEAGFRVHVTEDLRERHSAAVTRAWAELAVQLRVMRPRPPPADLAAMVELAEAWLLRLRLLESGALRLLRWHATFR